MTPAAAIQSFLGSFGIPAYASTSVPHSWTGSSTTETSR